MRKSWNWRKDSKYSREKQIFSQPPDINGGNDAVANNKLLINFILDSLFGGTGSKGVNSAGRDLESEGEDTPWSVKGEILGAVRCAWCWPGQKVVDDRYSPVARIDCEFLRLANGLAANLVLFTRATTTKSQRVAESSYTLISGILKVLICATRSKTLATSSLALEETTSRAAPGASAGITFKPAGSRCILALVLALPFALLFISFSFFSSTQPVDPETARQKRKTTRRTMPSIMIPTRFWMVCWIRRCSRQHRLVRGHLSRCWDEWGILELAEGAERYHRDLRTPTTEMTNKTISTSLFPRQRHGRGAQTLCSRAADDVGPGAGYPLLN